MRNVPLGNEIIRVIAVSRGQRWRSAMDNRLQLRKHIRIRLWGIGVASLGELYNGQTDRPDV